MARGLPFLTAAVVALLLILTIPFWIWPVDLTVQGAFFDPDQGAWTYRDAEPWKALYHFGTAPALLFVLGWIVVLLLGFWRSSWARWRRLALYFSLCMIVGPGLIVNMTFKDHWGRPRPREVTKFGGAYAHEKVWEYDASSPGKSFPCGHCSMGFYFFSLALALRRRRLLALAAAAGTIVFGVLIGMARVAQGGHFLSDVLWAGGFCFLTSVTLFGALGLHRNLFSPPREGATRRRAPVWVVALGGAAGVAVLLGGLVATPYDREETLEASLAGAGSFKLSLELEGNEHRIVAVGDDRVVMQLAGAGFGLPGSAIKRVWKDEPPDSGGGEYYLQMKQRRSGWFTELRQQNEIEAPAQVEGYAKVIVNTGDLELDLGALNTRQSWVVSVEPPGLLRVRRPKAAQANEDLKLEIDAAEVEYLE